MAHITTTYAAGVSGTPHKIASLFAANPRAEIVTVWSRGGAGRIGSPKGREIFYITSTSGKWGKPVEVRLGCELVKDKHLAAAEADAKAAAEQSAKRLAERDEQIAAMGLCPLRLAVARFHSYELSRPWWCGNTFGGVPRGGYASAVISPSLPGYASQARAVYAKIGDAEGVARADALIVAL